MKLNTTQEKIIGTIHNIIIQNDGELYNYHTLFSDDLVASIKENFNVINVGSFNDQIKPSNIAYIISVLKKTKRYMIKYCSVRDTFLIKIKK